MRSHLRTQRQDQFTGCAADHQSFNSLFGLIRNPWNVDRSACRPISAASTDTSQADAESLMNAVGDYGDDSIRVIHDVANAHFIGEAPTNGLRRVRDRLSLVHFSGTTRQSYKHDPFGCGDVPLPA